MFESSIRAVNKDGQKKEELSNVILIPQTEEIKADPFEVSLKGEAASECQRHSDVFETK